jgi:ATP-dependent RNA helicase DDX3X
MGGGYTSRPNFYERGSYGGKYSRGDQDYVPRRDESQGYWKNGVHHIAARNPRVEHDLFGAPDDSDRQHTGINFEKYDDIPVEASGTDVPEPITQFTSPPLDSHLLSNVDLARYNTPTPVQKYSIPIVNVWRDLMACAQTGKVACHVC